MKYHDTPPFAPVLMESTRAMGYSLEAAVADVIDNSIAAHADSVWIKYSPYDTIQYVSILDNGVGMTRQEIDDAMRYGSQSSLSIRGESDLGRFGLGLKTASLSQCRCLTVITKQDDIVEARRWDLDEVYRKGSWALIELDTLEIASVPQFSSLQSITHGTLVVWENLDRMLKGTASAEHLMSRQMDYVRDHLALVFHRYLSGESGIQKLSISINNLEIEPKDPFLIGRSTQFQADERFVIDGHLVCVSTFMLPHISNLTRLERIALGGAEGLSKNQGFYIYRNKRLLIWGTWFRMHRKDELSKLARIRVDIPNALDHLWTLDIRKSSAIPPDVIKSNLSRIVERISEGSKRSWTFRGKKEISDSGAHLWTKTSVREGVVYNLNRAHLLLKLLEDSLDSEQRKWLESYLRLAESNLPLNQLYVDLNNEEQVNVRKEKDAEKETLELAASILKTICADPMRKNQIQLLMISDPFCRFPDVVEMLKKELGEQND